MTSGNTKDRVAPTRPRRWRSLGVNGYVYAILVIALLLGTVQVAQMAGMWSTSGKLTGTGEKIVATGTDPAEIKGWMKLSEVLTVYKVPQAEFYAQFKIPADTSVDTPMNQLEKLAPGFSVDAVRTWLAQRKAQ